MPAGLQVVVVRSQASSVKCPVAEHFLLEVQSNWPVIHSSHSPPLGSQIVLQVMMVDQAVPVALHCCNVSGGLPGAMH